MAGRGVRGFEGRAWRAFEMSACAFEVGVRGVRSGFTVRVLRAQAQFEVGRRAVEVGG
ncbi:hypothetical protein K438DRAFT_1866317 [Mycena galopus ATCC 62051]|nr:hypothetical protein K438DRAFT_1866317 [Mycena galopus ATCC 62051]